MATILLTWELGAGIGHLMNLRPIGEMLARRGHRVVCVIRELAGARRVFAGTGIEYIPAPLLRLNKQIFAPARSLGHILGNIGFADETALSTCFDAWNTIFDLARPDLVVADHSPTALLALHGKTGPEGFRIPRANIGLGFFCPPASSPLPYWVKPHEKNLIPQIAQDERYITSVVNGVLQSHGVARLRTLSQIYEEVDETFLATYAEFDHFGPRSTAKAGPGRYWGHWPFAGGSEPRWPGGEGPKIYAYLKSFPTVEFMLSLLKQLGHPTLVFSGDIDPAVQERYSCSTLRFESQALDLRKVGEQCDYAVLNAGHGTAAGLLLLGKPAVQIPLFTEQLLFAQLVDKQKLGRMANPANPAEMEASLRGLLSDPTYRKNAVEFAAKYARFRSGDQVTEIVDRLENLARVRPTR